MNHKRLLPQRFGLMLVMLLLAACGGTTAQPTFTLVPPTAAPTPTPVSIPGIDEPIVVKDIRTKDPFGHLWTGDLKLQILDVYTEDSRQGGESGPIYPHNPDDIFLTLKLELDGPSNCHDWVAQFGAVVCADNKYGASVIGVKYDEGRVEGWFLSFELPRNSDFKGCAFRLPDKRPIELATFFD